MVSVRCHLLALVIWRKFGHYEPLPILGYDNNCSRGTMGCNTKVVFCVEYEFIGLSHVEVAYSISGLCANKSMMLWTTQSLVTLPAYSIPSNVTF